MTSALDLAGEEVRCSLGGGSFISGVVQQVNDDHVIVRGRSFPLSAVQLREDVEHLRKSNIDTDRRLRRVEQEAKEAAELVLKGEPRIPIIHPASGDYATFVAMIQAAGYTLYVRSRQDGMDAAISEYAEWTGGEELPENALYMHLNDDKAWSSHEWRLITKVELDSACPFPLAEAGTLGCGFKGDPCGIIHKNGSLEVNWNCIVGELVKNGLRAQR